MKSHRLLLATRDRDVEVRVAPALARWGFDVDVVRTNLELVWKLAARARGAPEHSVVVVDARPSSFGTAPLRWLREDPVSCAVVVLARPHDRLAIEAAELAEAARVVMLPAGRIRGGRVVREIHRVLRGPRRDRDFLRWTPPRSALLRPASARRQPIAAQ